MQSNKESRDVEKIFKKIENQFYIFQIHIKALQNLCNKKDSGEYIENICNGIYAFLIRSFFFDILDILIKFAANDSQGTEVKVNSQNRRSIIQSLKTASREYENIIKAYAIGTNKENEKLVDCLIDAASDVHIILRKIDKKREKKVVVEAKENFIKKIKTISVADSLDLFFFLLNYYAIHKLNIYIGVPSEIWGINSLYEICINSNHKNFFLNKFSSFHSLFNSVYTLQQNSKGTEKSDELMQKEKQLEVESMQLLSSFER